MPSAYLSALSEAPKADVLREVERQMERVERLRAALEPFSEVDGEGSEDFTDDTVVVKFGRTTHYALKLGDFRRARAALSDSKTPEGTS